MLPRGSACRARVARIAGSEAVLGLEFQGGGYVFGVHAGMPDAQRQLDRSRGRCAHCESRLSVRKASLENSAQSRSNAAAASAISLAPFSGDASKGSEPIRPSANRARKSKASRIGPVGAICGVQAAVLMLSG